MLLLLLVVVGASSALSLPHLFRGEDAAAKTETLVPSATYDSKVCQWFDNGVYSCVEQEGCLRARVDLEGNPVCRLSEKRNRAWSSTDALPRYFAIKPNPSHQRGETILSCSFYASLRRVDCYRYAQEACDSHVSDCDPWRLISLAYVEDQLSGDMVPRPLPSA